MEGPNCVIIAYLPRQEDSLQAIDIYFVSLIDFNLRKKIKFGNSNVTIWIFVLWILGPWSVIGNVEAIS
jgi:hypothetical protein